MQASKPERNQQKNKNKNTQTHKKKHTKGAGVLGFFVGRIEGLAVGELLGGKLGVFVGISVSIFYYFFFFFCLCVCFFETKTRFLVKMHKKIYK